MLEFTFWDVQHGNACYIHTPNNRHIVVDLGIGSYGDKRPFSPLQHLKANYGVTQLDYVLITHPHRDHIDDIENFAALNPKAIMRPSHLTEQEIRADNRVGDYDKIAGYLNVDRRYNATIQRGSPNDLYDKNQWGDVRISCFAPRTCNTGNLNNQSIVSVFEYANSKILIPGDNEPESWRELLENASFIEAARGLDVLLAPHHGRRSAYCPELFEAIGKPKITVISDGPESDTSATGSYGGQTTGWLVHYPDGTSEERLCVTTRRDGVIRVSAYRYDNKAYLNVHVGKGSVGRI